MYKQHSIPGFPAGAQKVCDALYIVEKDGWVQYFLWDDNYFSHLKDDVRSRRFILTSLMAVSYTHLRVPILCAAITSK